MKNDRMKVATAHAVITPPVGTRLGGYCFKDVSTSCADDLEMNGIVFDNGETRAAVISYDLIGLDRKYILAIRRAVAAELGVSVAYVILSCTHTHTGPNTGSENTPGFILEREYLEQVIIPRTVAAFKDWKERLAPTDLMHYSVACDQNINRRHLEFDNHAIFLPYSREFDALHEGDIRDQELSLLIAYQSNVQQPPYTVFANYAAHPLTSHSAGRGSFRISADFPGYFRSTVLADSAEHCCFATGAAGNMFPYEYETGLGAARRMGEAIAGAATQGIVNAKRHAARCRTQSDVIAADSVMVTVQTRKNGAKGCDIHPDYVNMAEVPLEIQALAIGDVVFVGVPGELFCELGLEIKWHSPFRKTFILYNSTDSFDYLCHGNALLQGGYEVERQQMNSRGGLALVNGAVDLLYKLCETASPETQKNLQ